MLGLGYFCSFKVFYPLGSLCQTIHCRKEYFGTHISCIILTWSPIIQVKWSRQTVHHLKDLEGFRPKTALYLNKAVDCVGRGMLFKVLGKFEASSTPKLCKKVYNTQRQDVTTLESYHISLYYLASQYSQGKDKKYSKLFTFRSNYLFVGQPRFNFFARPSAMVNVNGLRSVRSG